jgi:hypothetical protein
LLFWYSATVEGIAHHVCDGPHIGCAPVTADTSKPPIYTYRPALLVIKFTPPSAHTSCGPEDLAVKLGYCRKSAIPRAILLLATGLDCIVPSNLPRTDRVGCAPCGLAASGSHACSRKRWKAHSKRLARMPPNPKFAGADQGHAVRSQRRCQSRGPRARRRCQTRGRAREERNHCGAARRRSAARRNEARHAGGRRARRARDQRLKNPPKRTGTRRVPQWPGAPSNTPVSAAPHCRQAPPWSIFESEIV